MPFAAASSISNLGSRIMTTGIRGPYARCQQQTRAKLLRDCFLKFELAQNAVADAGDPVLVDLPNH